MTLLPALDRAQRLLLLLAPLLAIAGCDPPDRQGGPGAPDPSAATASPAHEFADLPLGGRLVVSLEPDAALVEGLVRFDAGSIHDPAGQTGLVEVLADALGNGGPMQLSGLQLHDSLREVGARLQVSASPEHLTFDFACPPAQLATTLEALADLVRFPHYPPEFVDRARVRLLERLDAEADDPGAIADQLLLDDAYGPDAPFTRAPTFASVEAVERGDLLAFHRAHLGANRMQVGVAGPLGLAEIRAALETALGELGPVAPAPVIEQPPFREADQLMVSLVPLPGADRTELRMLRPGVGVRDQDYASLRLWSDVHGTAAGSQLELATDSLGPDSLGTGIVTQLGAFFRPRWGDPGELLAYATTAQPDPTAAAERLSMWIVDARPDGTRQDALPGPVIAAARARVIAADEQVGRGRAFVGRLLDLESHGLTLAFWQEHQVQVRETGARRIRAAARDHTDRDDWRLAVVGPLPELHFTPGAVGRTATEALEPSEEDTLGERLATLFYRITGRPQPMGGFAVSVHTRTFTPRGTPEGLAALDRLFEALGGRAAWSELARLDVRGRVHTQGLVEPVEVRLWRDLDGDRLRLEQQVGESRSLRVVTPGDAWSQSGEQLEAIPREVLASVRFREARRLPRVLHDLATRRSMSVRLAGERLEVLRWGRLLCWLELGPDGRPTVMGYPATETERQGESEFTVWAEPTGGLVLPRMIEEPTVGRSYSWTEVRVNEPFAGELFER